MHMASGGKVKVKGYATVLAGTSNGVSGSGEGCNRNTIDSIR